MTQKLPNMSQSKKTAISRTRKIAANFRPIMAFYEGEKVTIIKAGKGLKSFQIQDKLGNRYWVKIIEVKYNEEVMH